MNEYIKDPKKLFIPLAARGFFRWMDDETFLKISYWVRGKGKLDLKNPKRFNDKLQWIKVNDHNPLYTKLVDKYEVKDYVSKIIGKEYVVPLLGIYSSEEEIDFSKLPSQFVLKCTHGSKCNVICKDKSNLSVVKTRKDIKKWLHMNWYDYGREWPYKNVTPRVLAEEYVEDESGELKDYKVLCFEGKPYLIQIHMGRFGKIHTQDYYDIYWNKLDIIQGSVMSDKTLPKPDFLDEMISLSGKLAKGLHEVRVDWYHANGKLIFGEMTFFDASGFDDFEPDEWNEKLGSMINVP